ncbi:MAG TPA: DNA gyrase inhibitor YacG [Burkholderiaceae bacterium]|nr:DNA gyrase inhibitor YacG [Burkholderiaceae bacterium]
MPSDTVATVPCPTCSAPVPWSPQNRYRPFCSERCKLIDLGAWASDRYAIDDNAAEAGEAGSESKPPG